MEKYLLIGALVTATIGAVRDVAARKIPNRLTYTALLVALPVRLLTLGWPGLRGGLLGVLLGGGLFYTLFVIGGMGGGDVKLMAAVAAWAGVSQTVYVLVVTAMAGGVIALTYMLASKRALESLSNAVELIGHHLTSGLRPHPVLNVQEPDSLRIPYGLAIAVGTLYCVGNTFLRG